MAPSNIDNKQEEVATVADPLKAYNDLPDGLYLASTVLATLPEGQKLWTVTTKGTESDHFPTTEAGEWVRPAGRTETLRNDHGTPWIRTSVKPNCGWDYKREVTLKPNQLVLIGGCEPRMRAVRFQYGPRQDVEVPKPKEEEKVEKKEGATKTPFEVMALYWEKENPSSGKIDPALVSHFFDNSKDVDERKKLFADFKKDVKNVESMFGEDSSSK